VPSTLRLLIIGIDGADYRAIARWIDEGSLPHLARLVERGALLPCRSTFPALTAPAWTTVLTGCNPGKHGVFDFQDFRYPVRRPWWNLPRGPWSWFRRAAKAGLSCGLVNVPMSFPADPTLAVVVPGFGAPDLAEDGYHPAGLREELQRRVPGYALMPNMAPSVWPGLSVLRDFTRMQAKAAAFALDEFRLDVLMVVFNALDWCGHGAQYSYEQGGQLLATAQAIDDEVGALVARTDWPNTPVALVSDHGMRCCRRQVNLHKLFMDLGLMRVEWEAKASSVGRAAGTALLRAWHAAKRVLPSGLVGRLRRAADPVRTAALKVVPRMGVDWAHTVAAPMGPLGCVRLNVRGRDPQGTIGREEYRQVRDEVIAKLRDARDPGTGERLFAMVAGSDTLYHGPFTGSAPDIIVTPNAEDLALGGAAVEEQLVLFAAQRGLVTPLRPTCGMHGASGIFILSGSDAQANGAPTECSLDDFAPTMLHLSGLPVPSYMDGRPLLEHLAGEAAARAVTQSDEPLPPPTPAARAYTEEDEQVLLGRLEALGYA
jgi:predicted AlkP superfamily phosphohydrolase/phosphomutase